MTINFCSNCGAKLEAGEKFCPSCGQEISAATNCDTTPYREDSGLLENLFNVKGRLNRWRYFKRSIGIFLLYVILLIATVAIFVDPSSGDVAVTGIILCGLLSILFPIGSICLTIRRLHDLNLTGWLCLLMTVPAVNTAFWIYTTFAPGTCGANQYGGDPLACQG